MKQKYKAVLFDFDGTIMNTNDIIIQSWQHTFRTVEGAERPISAITPTFGEPLNLTMAKLFPGRDTEEMVNTYREYQRKVYKEKIHMFPGIPELIAELKHKGYLMGIVTSRLWESTTQGLYKFDIAHLFDAVVSAEDTTVHKPDPTPCRICLEKLGLNPHEALFVGDSKFDVLCARNAGVQSVLVGWSICVTEEQKEGLYKPDHFIERPEELLEIL
ncbi:MAG: HAD-IA family hydrolase [Eubacteriales bacterium]|nr:HAD-IA family hydrolase [Eubacteriales bacterium]MDD4286415.1 HAD-IA family hydrolase [Eubacteriales bacterium]NLV69402.1 HAD-IA family hydrolase [Clostridiales bacterium]HPF19430.1 HAD-IA family hydrolase [Bacillota bacterium]HRV33639.1 HAD-IA family hydrolase [Anaerovoracaceae bacterium]